MQKMRMQPAAAQDRSGGLFEPDVLLPGQFFSFFRKELGFDRERRLMLAVLEDAIDCFQKYAYTTDVRGRAMFLESYDWIMSGERRWLFSFENICQIVDMDPDYIREGLARWRRKHEGQAPEARNAAADPIPLDLSLIPA